MGEQIFFIAFIEELGQLLDIVSGDHHRVSVRFGELGLLDQKVGQLVERYGTLNDRKVTHKIKDIYVYRIFQKNLIILKLNVQADPL